MKKFFKYKVLLYFFTAFLMLDIGARLPYEKDAYFSFYSIVPTMFTIGFILFLLALYLAFPKKYRNFFLVGSFSFYAILLIIHTIYKKHFGYYFSFKHISLIGEGTTYISEYINTIDIFIISMIIGSVCLLFLTSRYDIKRTTKPLLIVLVVAFLFCINNAYEHLGAPSYDEMFFLDRNDRDAFENFSNSNQSFSIGGLYMYTAKDLYRTMIKKQSINMKKTHQKIENFMDNRLDDNTNDFTGIFEDKDLIMIMLENIDDWMIDPNITPTIYKLQQSGINFTNHFSPIYTVGNTFATEFIANTGVIPQFYNSIVAYDFVNNDFSYALPNLFKDKSYVTNVYHTNLGTFYNRITNQGLWGYDDYLNSAQLHVELHNRSLDRYLIINGYDKIVHDEKYMSFIITYSGHMPFVTDKLECSNNLNFVKSHVDSDDTSYLCALAQAHETDTMIKELIDRLENDNRLDNTALVIFTDHYSYSYGYFDMVAKLENESDPNLIQQTPFFIWSNDIEPIEIEEVTSTIDILPTVANLFGLDYNPKLYIGTDALGNYHDGIVFFSDYSWFNGKVYYKNNEVVFCKDSAPTYSKKIQSLSCNVTEKEIETINKFVLEKIEIGTGIGLSDYYHSITLENKK